jgi:hypothetical protein
MLQNYAVIDRTTKEVVNNIMWDGESYLDPMWKNDYDFIPWDESTIGSPVNVGYIYSEQTGEFIAPLIKE